MSKLFKVIHNLETGEIKEVPLSEEDLATLAIDKLEADFMESQKTKAKADKEAAQAKLAALGLTVDDLKALGL
jgi:hypothetical protein